MCLEPMRWFVMADHEGHPAANRLEAAARAMVGVPFRSQGRGRGGCDCLGLVIQVAAAAGIAVEVAPLPLRGMRLRDARVLLMQLGLREVAFATAGVGDMLMQVPATLQLHLAIRVSDGIVEAHAGLRRVVVRPIICGESWDSAWRLPMGDF